MALRILIVEDEETVRRLLARILQPPRFDVIQASTSEEAQRHLDPPPDLIVLDLGLGSESGEGLCHSVHHNPLTHKVPILILTGRDMPELEDSDLASCAQDLLHKPFDSAELVFHIEMLLKKAAFKVRRYKGGALMEIGDTVSEVPQ